MSLKIFLFIFTFSLSLESPPTNCKTCYGHFLLYHELDTEEKKLENIKEFCSRPEWLYTFPFEYGLLDWVKKDGINNVVQELEQCTKKPCIKELCSRLSGKPCNYI